MSDNPPYDLGVFARIVNVQFGGQWLALATQGSTDVGQSVTFTFNGKKVTTYQLMAGGAPGPGLQSAPLDLNFPSRMNGWPAVTAANLENQLTSSIAGFGAASTASGLVDAMVFIETGQGLISGSKFTIRCNLGGPQTNPVLVFGSFMPKNAMKPKIPFPTKFAPSNGVIQSLFTFGSGTATSFNFTVDPVKLTVSLPS